MSARQRLRSGLQISRLPTICWRCSLRQQQRWRSSSARVSTSNPLHPKDSLSRCRIPEDVSSAASRRVKYSSTRDHHSLPQDALPPATFSTHGDIADERGSSLFDRKICSPPRSAGISPAIAAQFSQRSLWKNLPVSAATGQPSQRNRKNTYTYSAVGKLQCAISKNRVN